MNINNFKINTSLMPNTGAVKQFVVDGDIGAQFQIIVLQNPSSSSAHTLYYDFFTKAFETGHNDLNNNLIVTLESTVYKNNIIFPSGGGDFVVKLIALNGTSIKSSNAGVLSREILGQSSAATITFQAETANTNNYETFPTTTSTGALNSSSNVTFDWTITNNDTDAHGFGLIPNTTSTYFNDLSLENPNNIQKRLENAWYFKKTAVTDSVLEDSVTHTLIALTDLALGMQLTSISSGTLVGTAYITKIDTSNKIITLNTAQTLGKGITLTFKAYGASIAKSIGMSINFSKLKITFNSPLLKTVRANVSSSTSVTLNNTLGLAGGDIVTYSGVGVNNSASNKVTSVTADADGSGGDGVAVVELAQTLTAGTKLKFTGSVSTVNIQGSIEISGFPDANRTINFALDEFLSVGATS